MPTYDYECTACDHKFEAFHAMSAEPLVVCPKCNQPKLIKLIGMGAAVIIRGTENPCRGNRGRNAKKRKASQKSQNQPEKPFWRDGPVNKEVLKNPERYIRKGEID